ncbi:MAG: ABC transporter substrate-binding protein [Cytophagaceae bacterium]|nr:ABC transporter substrate-binding protein [Cytophagaceae bacterium]
MKKIRLAGVPEHFNFPVHMGIENGTFKEHGIEVAWHEYPDGTGSMNKALRAGEVDMAIILLEGVVRDIVNGNPTHIVQNYVASPLLWGIHVAAGSKFKSERDLQCARVAISRYGSGSHLMAYLHADAMGWDTSTLKFVEIGTLQGAVDALTNNEADYFMWEHFTTKPVVDKGIFRWLADFPTPWSSFVIVATKKFLEENEQGCGQFLDALNFLTKDFKNTPGITKTLSQRYLQKEEDLNEWIKHTQWSQEQVSKQEIENVVQKLQQLDIIGKEIISKNILRKI